MIYITPFFGIEKLITAFRLTGNCVAKQLNDSGDCPIASSIPGVKDHGESVAESEVVVVIFSNGVVERFQFRLHQVLKN